MIAGTLEIQMLANMARLADDMKQAKNVVGSTMKDIEGTVASAKSALGALGIGLGIGYFVSLIKGSVDAMDHLHDLRKTTNLTAETLAGLRVAAKQSGTDLESVAASINKLSVEVGKAPEKFRALGISAKDPLEQYKQLADVSNNLADINQRNAVLNAALGKSWQANVPLLAEGSAKIGEMVTTGSRLSGVTTEMTQQADALNDKWVLLGGTGGMLIRIIGPILPLLNLLTEEMLKSQKGADKLDHSFTPLKDTLQVLAVLYANLAFMAKTAGNEIAASFAHAATVLKGDFAGADAIRAAKQDEMLRLKAELDAFEAKIMGAGLTGKAVPGEKVDPAAAAAAAARAKGFLGGSKDGMDNEAIAEIIAEHKAMEAQEQHVRDALHKVREAEDKRELEQIAAQNQAKADAEAISIRQGLEAEEAAQDERDRIQRESVLGRIQFEKQARAAELAGAQSFLGNLAGLMNTHSKRAFEVGKVAAMSQAAVSGALAVMDAWKAGMSTGGPWAPFVAGAYAAAAGLNALNLINNIRKQQFGGGGGISAGGGGGGVPVSPSQGSSGFTSPQQTPQGSKTEVTINITGVVTQNVLDSIKDQLTQFFGSDGVLVPAGSRQASVITTGV